MKAVRVVTGVVIGLSVVVMLTGCEQPGGPEAQAWLESQPTVTSVQLDYEVNGLQKEPKLTASVDETATDSQLTALVAAVDDRLTHAKARVPVTLTLGDLSVEFDAAEQSSRGTAWLAFHHDPRITGGLVADDVSVESSRADLASVYRDHLVTSARLAVNERDESGSVGSHIRAASGCTPTPAQLDNLAAVLADQAFTRVDGDPCGATTVAAGDLESFAAVLTHAAGLGRNDITVVFDAEHNNEFQNAAYSVSLAHASAGALALVTAALLLKPTELKLDAQGALAIDADFDSAASLFSDPNASAVVSLRVTAAQDTITATSRSAFDRYRAFAAEARADFAEMYVVVTDTEVTLTLTTGDVTPDIGKRLLDVIDASGLAEGRVVSIEGYRSNRVVITDGIARAEGTSKLGPELVVYWNSTHS